MQSFFFRTSHHQSMLREMGESFNFNTFKRLLEEKKKSKEFNPAQMSGLKQRMALLEAFLDAKKQKPRFVRGQLTIVDLTDPFIDPSSACSIFEVVTRLFVRAELDTGKVLVVDEAHKVRSCPYLRCDLISHKTDTDAAP